MSVTTAPTPRTDAGARAVRALGWSPLAQTLAHNHRMRRVFARLSYPLVTRAGGGVVDVELDLRARPVTAP